MKRMAFICAVAFIATMFSGDADAQTVSRASRPRIAGKPVPSAAEGMPATRTAKVRKDDLRFASYATSRHVEQLATDEAVRARAWETIQRMGLTKLYIEVYRSGHVVSPEHLIFVRDWLRDKGIDVVGGIATVPGGDFGVRQEGPLDWFNWQNEKTQRDLEKVMRTAAKIFDTFIIDDFLCTGDVSAESQAAKGDRSWGEYRRSLMTDLARSIFVGPAKEVNPDITMIVKYPQWYDRFHLFGYDTQTLPQIFDQVWVGTETRGRNTQRYGFVQPYEGFVNYRWLSGIAGDKIGGAWFDHGDCKEYDFLDQAYTSVLAGASELVFFNFNNVIQGHSDHEKVIAEFDMLADLAEFVREHPVIGIPAYKPPNSDPAGDMYIMDFLGMLGIPLIPVHEFPKESPVIFLPAQAAADPKLMDHIRQARDRDTRLILTTNLLIASQHNDELARMVGINQDIHSKPLRAQLIQKSKGKKIGIDLESPIEGKAGPGNIICTSGGKKLALLIVNQTPNGSIALLNTHTYSQADFDAVGEVLLCPRPLGLLELEGSALQALRKAFSHHKLGIPTFDSPGCVTFHPLGSSGSCVIQNFNDRPIDVTVTMSKGKPGSFKEGFSGRAIPVRTVENNIALDLSIPARDRVWVRRDGFDLNVEAEEVVTRYTPANNGAGPMWCYGSTVIARQNDDVYLSVIETGQDVPLLCNTRWQLWRRSTDGWRMEQSEKEYRQREPCPIAVFQQGPVFLSANPSTEPPGTKYGPCQPLVLEFDPANLSKPAKVHEPVWADGTYFTDHSYRGFAADGANGELLLLNINAKSSEQYVSYRDGRGQWHQKGTITFPIRACYPQVALRDGAAHVMAIGDIVEPVAEWQKLKFEKLKSKWDYVFRRLFYTYTNNIKSTGFCTPIEIDTVEKTCGHITNLDLYIDKEGAAHLLYLKRPHQYDFIRDKYFPGQAMTVHLEYVTVKDGKIVSSRTLAQIPSDATGIEPSYGRFHINAAGELYVIVAGTGIEKGRRAFGNYIGRIGTNDDKVKFKRVELQHPFHNFFTNTPRGGSQPSNVIDLFGIADDHPNLRYAQIRIEPYRD
ncbi:MAG: hypothetical protein JXM79_05200 [Sedimentisphaerales bacterium]|nr:hypothetical protein [Sedimentisphaerales bacterium]